MDKLQNQLATGRKFAHISDDPIALIYSQAARNKIARLANYQRSVQTAQDWLTQAEDGIMEMQRTLVYAYEETVSAANDTKGSGVDADKRTIAPLIQQLGNNLIDTLNMTFGDKYVFGGYNTPGDPTTNTDEQRVRAFVVEGEPPRMYFNGFDLSQFDRMPPDLYTANLTGLTAADVDAMMAAMVDSGGNPMVFSFDGAALLELHSLRSDIPTFDVGPGIEMPVTMNGIDLVMFMTPDENGNMVMRNTWSVMQELYELVEAGASAEAIGDMIKPLQDAQNHLLTQTADIGGRVRRLELLEARFEQDAINYERMRSDAEDVDMAEVIMHLKMAEAIYQAALSAGARIIQPTLMDFLR